MFGYSVSLIGQFFGDLLMMLPNIFFRLKDCFLNWWVKLHGGRCHYHLKRNYKHINKEDRKLIEKYIVNKTDFELRKWGPGGIDVNIAIRHYWMYEELCSGPPREHINPNGWYSDFVKRIVNEYYFNLKAQRVAQIKLGRQP